MIVTHLAFSSYNNIIHSGYSWSDED